MNQRRDVQLSFLLKRWLLTIRLFIVVINNGKINGKTNREVPFELCFKYHLENGYTFKELTPENVKQFQIFLDKVSQMTVTQVDKAYSRKPDTDDVYNGMQVYHYAVTEVFRIHVVIEAGYYKIIRLDPRHKLHRS